jgi:hypothetical protein
VQDFLSPVMMSPKNLRVLLMIYVPTASVIVACKCVALHFFETSSLVYVGIIGLVGLYFVPSYMYLKRIGFL